MKELPVEITRGTCVVLIKDFQDDFFEKLHWTISEKSLTKYLQESLGDLPGVFLEGSLEMSLNVFLNEYLKWILNKILQLFLGESVKEFMQNRWKSHYEFLDSLEFL